MNEREIEARREYFRQWRKNHKENVKRYNETFWAKKAAGTKEVNSSDSVKAGAEHEL